MNIEIKEKVLKILSDNQKKPVSGEYIAKELNISRAYVWKAITALRQDGCCITSKTNLGYQLNTSDFLSKEIIKENLPGFEIIIKDLTASTNDDAKKLAQTEKTGNAVIIAKSQTNGKGRLGRSFYSPKDTGIYFSILLHPQMSMEESLMLTPTAAVSVAEAIKKQTGKDAQIKWVNDIFMGGKKVCGILTEAAFDMEMQRPSYVVIGIGINLLTEDFPEDIKNIAGSTGQADKNMLIADIVNGIMRLEKQEVSNKYKELSCVLNKEVEVVGKGYFAKAVDMTEDCNLILEKQDGEKVILKSGEISIKIKN